MIKKLFAAIGALLLLVSLPLTSSAARQFPDVPASKHFAEAVYNLEGRGIIGGYPDGTFKPGESITRGQAAAIIAKLVQLDMTNVKDPKFKDVRPANGYYKAIAALADKGIISGYGDGRFGPNDKVTRAQMATILVKAFDLPRYEFSANRNPFTDVKTAKDHDVNILIIYRLGITKGTSVDKFSPNQNITRGQAAKLMKTAEDVKSQIATIYAKDVQWDDFKWSSGSESDAGAFNVVKGWTQDGKAVDRLHVVPLKQGKGTLSFGRTAATEGREDIVKKYGIAVSTVSGKLKVTVNKGNDTNGGNNGSSGNNGSGGNEITPSKTELLTGNRKAEHVALATMSGKKVNDNAKFTQCNIGSVQKICLSIETPGQYIASVRFADGKTVRYGIDVKTNGSVTAIEEKTTAVYEFGTGTRFGNHTLPPEAWTIASVERDSETNTFRAEGKKQGSFTVSFPDSPNKTKGLGVTVTQIGSILHVSLSPVVER